MQCTQVPALFSAQLRRGTLNVTVKYADVAPESLFAFAERENPRRAFLFVSKVLGRHIPVRPSVMAGTFERLAAKIPADLPGPVLVIGMAETATGLGAGVHRAFSVTRPDALYMVSTRHSLGTELFTRFEEEHSHATAHLIHLPIDPDIREMMLSARSLILVDDEASTGQTFVNLYRALADAGLARLERVVTCVLTDWSDDAVRTALGETCEQVSLLRGAYHFDEDCTATLPDMAGTSVVALGKWPLIPEQDWGRLGVRHVDDCLAPDLQIKPGESVIVLGTGEFVWQPFLLAERLQRAGADVWFSATSRSPIAPGHAIEHTLAFADNYGLGLPNFLYNVRPGQFDRVLICGETPAPAWPAELIAALGAEVIVHGR